MQTPEHPYKSLPKSAFWRTAIAEKHYADFSDLSEPLIVASGAKIATAGSCFAQHIGRALRSRSFQYLDCEPAPHGLTPEEAHRHGFGVFSCRYGNIYTVAQLLQLMKEAFGQIRPMDPVWTRDGRYYDSQRISVDLVGHDSAEDVLALREQHLSCVRDMFINLDIFVFTLGLTEAWRFKQDGSVFPNCPGTGPGQFDPNLYSFHNYNYPEIASEFVTFRERLKWVNPRARILLTVSPVPLTATASGKHVLPATVYSKSTLRAVAGDMADKYDDVSYFPSYEIIASHPMRGIFFNPDGRTVNATGVELVMKHFFAALQAGDSTSHDVRKAEVDAPQASVSPDTESNQDDKLGLICDEEKLDAFS